MPSPRIDHSPHGRRSETMCVARKRPCTANHCTRCAGSVSASNTRCAGARIVISTTTWSSLRLLRTSLGSVRFMGALDEALQVLQLLGPERRVVRDPVADGDERRAVQFADAVGAALVRD